MKLSQRATQRLAAVRAEYFRVVDTAGLVVAAWDSSQVRWWTWAGARANGVVAAALASVQPGLVDELDRYDNRYIKLRGDATVGELRAALLRARDAFGEDLAGVDAPVSDNALKQLKFAELLPPALAAMTLSARGADATGSRVVTHAYVLAGTAGH